MRLKTVKSLNLGELLYLLYLVLLEIFMRSTVKQTTKNFNCNSKTFSFPFSHILSFFSFYRQEGENVIYLSLIFPWLVSVQSLLLLNFKFKYYPVSLLLSKFHTSKISNLSFCCSQDNIDVYTR